MALFGGRRPRLPQQIIQMMERYGRFDFDAMNAREGGGVIWKETQEPLATEHPDVFVTELARAVVPVGGWAAFGAAHTVRSILGAGYDHPAQKEILDASVAFLRSNGVPPIRVAGLEWNHWLAGGGTVDTWLPPKPLPAEPDARLTPLGPGEIRRLAQLESRPDSNVIFVRIGENGRHEQIVEARYSDEDSSRSQRVDDAADSHYALYEKIGRRLQTPPFWADPELIAFIPLPPPKI
jgi:hypothetical protein